MKKIWMAILTAVMACILACASLAEEIDIEAQWEDNDRPIQWVEEQDSDDLNLQDDMMVEGDIPIIYDAASSSGVKINNKNYPDERFRSYVSEEIDSNGDGVLSSSERKAVKEIYIDDIGAYSLAGIEFFTALEKLHCDNNRLTSLNVKNCRKLQMLSCRNNRLKSLDVSKNTKLVYLYCEHNSLTKLKLGKNKALYELYCYDNKSLKTIDLAGCGEMKDWVECLINKYKDKEEGKTYYGWYEKEGGIVIDRTTSIYNGKKLLYKPGNPTSVTLAKKSITINAGSEKQIAVKMKPAGVASYCTFTSSNPQVASVSKHYNYIYANKKGTATITVKTSNGLKAKIKVKVTGVAPAW